MEEEIWKPVPDMAGVWASSWGRIKSDPTEYKTPTGGKVIRFIKPTFGSISKADRLGNYFRLLIRIRGKTYKVHILVCSAFRGRRQKKSDVVLHKDDNGLNNRSDNLDWGTQYENMQAPRFKYLMSEAAAARVRAADGRFSNAA